MKYALYAFLLAALLWLANDVQARIYQTSDAVIVEAEDFTEEKKARSLDNDLDAESSLPFEVPSVAPALHGFARPNNRVLPGGTFLIADRSCWTPDGQFGTCTSMRSCYPNIRLPSQKDLDSWLLSARATCAFVESDGRQAYGVCCPDRQFPSFVGVAMNPGFPIGFPWWPMSPYFPFSPGPISSGSIPNVTVRPPSSETTTKPWWVPSSTTSSSATTSPWWVPETSSTSTSKPSTTSPWWVPEPSSTSTSKPTTTSPWWIPESSTAKPTPPTQPSIVESAPNESKTSCGKGPFKALDFDEQKRIVGGTDAVKDSWPFIVGLFNNKRHFCGGSIISQTYILTAAHCIAHMSSIDLARLEVAIGMHTLRPYDSSAIRKRVRRVVRHKGFNPTTLYNDVAVLALDSPIDYTSSISPVCLPSVATYGSNSFEGVQSVVIGWGALKEGGRQPDVLQQVTVQVQSNSRCATNYGSDSPGGIADHMICAAYPGKDSCSGDSGGPMITQVSPGASWLQIGIVSWGIGCGKAPYPGVYTRVTSFIEWIEKNSQP